MTEIIVDRYELYRVILDYEALQDGFIDRVDEMEVPLTEVDAAGGLTRGNTQKLLVKNPEAKWARKFGWDSLGKVLKGTGLALLLVVDDERFAPIKADMLKRRHPHKPRAKPLSKAALSELIAGTFANHGKIGGRRRSDLLSPRQRREIARAGAKARWSKRFIRKRDASPAE